MMERAIIRSPMFCFGLCTPLTPSFLVAPTHQDKTTDVLRRGRTAQSQGQRTAEKMVRANSCDCLPCPSSPIPDGLHCNTTPVPPKAHAHAITHTHPSTRSSRSASCCCRTGRARRGCPSGMCLRPPRLRSSVSRPTCTS